MEVLRETPLIGRHREQKALMAPFGGWNMPIQYEGDPRRAPLVP